MRKLGLDLGDRTLGIAISDIEGKLARGLETVRFETDDTQKPLTRLAQLLTEYDVDTLVLGFPKNMNNTIGVQAEKVLQFQIQLTGMFSQPVILYDERLTTRLASQQMVMSKRHRKKRKSQIDQEAAAVILQGYLDSI